MVVGNRAIGREWTRGAVPPAVRELALGERIGRGAYVLLTDIRGGLIRRLFVPSPSGLSFPSPGFISTVPPESLRRRVAAAPCT